MRPLQSGSSIRFELPWSRLIGFNSLVLFFVAQVLLLPQASEAVWSKYRSVRRCDRLNKLSQPFRDERDCSNHCETVYVRTSMDMMQKNHHLSQSHLLTVGGADGGGVECCCLYDAPWPEFVRPELIGRHPSDKYKTYGKLECLPLVISVNLSQRTKETYETLCKYLARKEPLTMLELMRYVDAAYYLNYMAPRHVSIWKTLKLKDVNRLDKEAMSQVRAMFYNELLDTHVGPLESYEGYQLGIGKLKQFINVKKELKQALRSPMVARAYDELVLSHMIVDISAAFAHIQLVNHEHIRIPEHLLQGQYDKYDTKNRAIYFTLPHLDCRSLRQTSNRLDVYLKTLKAVSDVLYEKLTYEQMTRDYKYLVSLIDVQKVYQNLLEVNCH